MYLPKTHEKKKLISLFFFLLTESNTVSPFKGVKKNNMIQLEFFKDFFFHYLIFFYLKYETVTYLTHWYWWRWWKKKTKLNYITLLLLLSSNDEKKYSISHSKGKKKYYERELIEKLIHWKLFKMFLYTQLTAFFFSTLKILKMHFFVPKNQWGKNMCRCLVRRESTCFFFHKFICFSKKIKKMHPISYQLYFLYDVW